MWQMRLLLLLMSSPRLPARCSCFAQATHEAEWYLLTVTAFLNSLRAMAWTCSDSVVYGCQGVRECECEMEEMQYMSWKRG
jgi:hypothetical protein